MFSKRPLPEDAASSADPAERLRVNLVDLFLSNQMSGLRAQTVFADVDANRVRGFKKLAQAGKHGSRQKDVARDLRNTKKQSLAKAILCAGESLGQEVPKGDLGLDCHHVAT